MGTVDPFIGNRTAVIIQMIVHSKAALMSTVFLRRKKSHITVIVVGKKDDGTVKSFPAP